LINELLSYAFLQYEFALFIGGLLFYGVTKVRWLIV